MKAVCFDTPGKPDVMKVSNCEIPEINDEISGLIEAIKG